MLWFHGFLVTHQEARNHMKKHSSNSTRSQSKTYQKILIGIKRERLPLVRAAARRAGISHSLVSRVLNGRATSARALAAVQAELEQLARENPRAARILRRYAEAR